MARDKDTVKKELEQFLNELSGTDKIVYERWDTVLTYCLGYYETIDLAIIWAIRELQSEGKIL